MKVLPGSTALKELARKQLHVCFCSVASNLCFPLTCMYIVSQAAWDSLERKSQPMPLMIFCKPCFHRTLVLSTISIRDYYGMGSAFVFLSVHAVTNARLPICATTIIQW